MLNEYSKTGPIENILRILVGEHNYQPYSKVFKQVSNKTIAENFQY